MKKAFTKIGTFFKKAGKWIKNHLPTKRRLIQLYAALLTNANLKGFFTGRIYTGATKNFCVPGLNCYSCPGAIGACPLGSLQNALAASGTRAPVYILGILALLGLLLGRTICGFLCPLGLCQDLAYKIKSPKLKKSRVTRILSYLKYVLLIALVVVVPLAFMAQGTPLPAFCKYICPAGTFGGAISLLLHPDNSEMFAMLGGLFTWKFALFVLFFVASVFIYRPFCRFVCPLGAIYGFFNKIALLGVKLDKNKCTDCGLCVAHCKMDIKHVGDHECINCGECIAVCPAKAISWKGSSLFVRPNETDAAPQSASPLNGMLHPAPQAQLQQTAAEPTVQLAPPAAEPTAPAAAAAVPARPRKFVIGPKGQKALRITAYVAAALVLGGALVYYNFIDSGAPSVGSEVGDIAPDFTITRYDGGEFTLSERVGEDGDGKIYVLNFWYTTCTPCVEELPDINRFARDYEETVTVLAIHSVAETEDVAAFIAQRGWDEYPTIFAHDSMQTDADGEETGSVYDLFGGRSTYPMTVIVNADGVIAYRTMAKIGYDELVEVVDSL